jgi:predicted transcriptional regulator
MSGGSALNVPEELREKIEQAARERNENPSSLIASAVNLLLETEQLQVEEVRRRLAARSGSTVRNDRVMAWLDTWGRNGEIPRPNANRMGSPCCPGP